MGEDEMGKPDPGHAATSSHVWDALSVLAGTVGEDTLVRSQRISFLFSQLATLFCAK